MNRLTHRLAAAIALTLGVAACAPTTPVVEDVPVEALPTFEVPAPATAQQRELAGRQVEELDRMLALDTRCNWLDPAARAALAATAEERRAWLAWQNGEPAAPQPADASCSNKEVRTAVEYGSWQMRVTWALRAHALLDRSGATSWQSGLSSVEAQRAGLQEASDGLEARYAASIQQARPGIESEAQQMLATRCQATACPTLPHDPAFAAYADVWLKQAEAYAVVLAGMEDKLGAPPADDEDANTAP